MDYSNVRRDRIPKARDELEKVASRADALGVPTVAQNIRDIVAGLMHRRPAKKPVARARQMPITPDMVRSVLAYSKENPHLHNREVGRVHGIDGGRVSEILHGIRTVENPGGRR